MFDATEIANIAAEYDDLKTLIQTTTDGNHDLPEDLCERESVLVRRLISVRASSGLDLARKAFVLLDWLTPEDVPTELAASLCPDIVRLFQPSPEAATP